MEDTLKTLFRQGLNLELQSELDCRDEGKGFDDFVSLAIRINNLVRVRRPARSLSTTVPSPHKDCEPMPVGRARLTTEERERRFKERLCLYCGEPGHILATCPIRPSQTCLSRVSSTFPTSVFDCMEVPVTFTWQDVTIHTKALLDSRAAVILLIPG